MYAIVAGINIALGVLPLLYFAAMVWGSFKKQNLVIYNLIVRIVMVVGLYFAFFIEIWPGVVIVLFSLTLNKWGQIEKSYQTAQEAWEESVATLATGATTPDKPSRHIPGVFYMLAGLTVGGILSYTKQWNFSTDNLPDIRTSVKNWESVFNKMAELYPRFTADTQKVFAPLLNYIPEDVLTKLIWAACLGAAVVLILTIKKYVENRINSNTRPGAFGRIAGQIALLFGFVIAMITEMGIGLFAGAFIFVIYNAAKIVEDQEDWMATSLAFLGFTAVAFWLWSMLLP